MANRYYVEMGERVRVFRNTPPTNPRGPVVEITELEWKELEKTPREEWKLESKNDVVSIITKKSNEKLIKSLIHISLGIIIGIILTYMLMK